MGGPCVNFVTDAKADFSNGNATINPTGTNKGGTGLYNTLDITVPGYQFGDFLFSAKVGDTANGDPITLKVEALLNGIVISSFVFTDSNSQLKKNADQDYLVLGLTSAMTEIRLTADGGFITMYGFEGTKHFDISDVQALCADVCPGGHQGDPTPLPAALPLFATGLGALGLLGWRRKRKAAAPPDQNT